MILREDNRSNEMHFLNFTVFFNRPPFVDGFRSLTNIGNVFVWPVGRLVNVVNFKIKHSSVFVFSASVTYEADT
jgi:hypothetical protein